MELAVEAVGLVKMFDEVRAVAGIDLEIRRGQVFGVLGPNGAGKTTMLKMLATLLPIDGGRARVFGVDVAANPHQVRQLVGVTGQYASVDENLTGRENLVLFGRLLGLPRPKAFATADELLASFGVGLYCMPTSSRSRRRSSSPTSRPAAAGTTSRACRAGS